MNNALSDQLAEQWRDALSAYVTHHVMSEKLQASALNMITPDHLDRYFMLDTQVTSAVKTSYLAEALACTQNYINSIFNNIEPGYLEAFDPTLVAFWRQGMSNYSLWAAYQMLEDYPENYIRADLRLDKTQLFKTLEEDLGQAKISDASVQNALLTYLQGYEYQNSIRVQSGYIDYIGSHLDDDGAAFFSGYGYANSDYYLLGQDTAPVPQYYWRKVAVRLDEHSTFIQPDAWSEWQPITLPGNSTIMMARLVLFCGRLHLVWLGHDAPVERQFTIASNRDEPVNHYLLKLQLIYLGLDGNWSSPELLWSGVETTDLNAPLTVDYRLLALAIPGARGSDDQLLVATRKVITKDNEIPDEIRSIQRDVLKRPTPSEDSLSSDAVEKLFDYFAEAPGRLTLQMRLAGSEWWVTGVRLTEQEDPFLTLEVVSKQDAESQHVVDVRGASSEIDYELIFDEYFFRRSKHTQPVENHATVELSSDAAGKPFFSCSLVLWPNFSKMDLLHGDDVIASLSGKSFEGPGPYYESSTSTFIGFDFSTLGSYTQEEIREGAGFAIRIDEHEPLPLYDDKNFVKSRKAFLSRTLALKIDGGASVENDRVLNGGAVTEWVSHSWEGKSEDETATTELKVEFGAKDRQSTFTIIRSRLTDPSGVSKPYISQHTSGTDFLVFDYIGGTAKPLVARLNSQHVPDLINRAQASPQAVFAWDAQHMSEPPYQSAKSASRDKHWRPTSYDPLMNLYDAYGMYLRELFFHVPHLIASRLGEEERFEEARQWLGLVFNPQQKQAPTETPGVEFWNCAWLLLEDTEAAGLEHQLIDPHVIALHKPSHYRKAVFVQYVQLLIDEADLHYRRQTRDSLANAWLLYRMAADLMGEVPDARAIDTWTPKTVAALLKDAHSGQMLEAHAEDLQPANLPKSLSTFFWAGVAAHPDFRLPVNQQLLDVWRVLEQRFYNLRHYLTLEGFPMQLALYAPAANPFDLLMARMGGNANLSHLLGYRTVVPPYRFRTLIGKAHETVSALMQFGEQLRSYLELEERTGLEALQFQQAAELAGYTIGIQEELYNQQLKNEMVLKEQQSATQDRYDYYKQLHEQHISAQESGAMEGHKSASNMINTGARTSSAGRLLDLTPNVFGMSTGGAVLSSGALATGMGIESSGMKKAASSDIQRDTSGYLRRREDWGFQYHLADKELRTLNKQLEMQTHTTLAAFKSLEHSRQALKQTQALYAFYQSKSTSVSLYRWLRSQATTWHATLFDVAVSLCNSAEACWQFETGSFEKRVMRTPVWQGDRYGLNAAGELRLDLHRLESEAMLRNERHLELHKWVSLRALLAEGLVSNAAGKDITDWDALVTEVQSSGQLFFSLSEVLFNKDYPGHYLRRLHSVTLSLPALLGPYQNIRATLTQTHSQLLCKPDINGVKFLIPELEDDEADGRNVMISLRPRQQVSLSSANRDSGMFTAAESDDRYLPFEGTGAVSSWHLKFPRHAEQAEMLASLSDIVLEVRYFALHGGEVFEEAVEGLLVEPAHRRSL